MMGHEDVACVTQRFWRITNGISQLRFATMLNRRQQTIARWESADPKQRRDPSIRDLVKIEEITAGHVRASSYTIEAMRVCAYYERDEFPHPDENNLDAMLA